jgi:hypothetical protein
MSSDKPTHLRRGMYQPIGLDPMGILKRPGRLSFMRSVLNWLELAIRFKNQLTPSADAKIHIT